MRNGATSFEVKRLDRRPVRRELRGRLEQRPVERAPPQAAGKPKDFNCPGKADFHHIYLYQVSTTAVNKS